MKNTIYISIIGKINTGKTTLMKKVAKDLADAGIEVDVTWGIEGVPTLESPMMMASRLRGVAAKTKVSITEFQQRRTSRTKDSAEEIRVKLTYTVGIGYEVGLHILGTALRHNFGDYPVSRDRCKALGARLAAELGVDIDDELPSSLYE